MNIFIFHHLLLIILILFSFYPPVYATTDHERSPSLGASREIRGIDLSCDFLYYKAVSDSSSFVFKTTPSLDTPNTGNWGGVFVYPDWDYDFGFRTNIATPVRWGAWLLSAGWMFFKNTSDKVSVSSPEETLFNQASSPDLNISGNNFVKEANGVWSLHMHLFDLSMKSPIFINHTIHITPKMGIEGSLIRQKLICKYSDFLIQNLAYNDVTSGVSYKNNTWGVGPMLGAEVSLNMPYLFTIKFLSEFSLLFGECKAKTHYNNIPEVDTDIVSNITMLFPHTRIQVNLQKEWRFWGCCWGFIVGWETQIFSRQLNAHYYSTIVSGSTGSDLMIQGPFFRGTLRF